MESTTEAATVARSRCWSLPSLLLRMVLRSSLGMRAGGVSSGPRDGDRHLRRGWSAKVWGRKPGHSGKNGRRGAGKDGRKPGQPCGSQHGTDLGAPAPQRALHPAPFPSPPPSPSSGHRHGRRLRPRRHPGRDLPPCPCRASPWRGSRSLLGAEAGQPWGRGGTPSPDRARLPAPRPVRCGRESRPQGCHSEPGEGGASPAPMSQPTRGPRRSGSWGAALRRLPGGSPRPGRRGSGAACEAHPKCSRDPEQEERTCLLGSPSGVTDQR